MGVAAAAAAAVVAAAMNYKVPPGVSGVTLYPSTVCRKKLISIVTMMLSITKHIGWMAAKVDRQSDGRGGVVISAIIHPSLQSSASVTQKT